MVPDFLEHEQKGYTRIRIKSKGGVRLVSLSHSNLFMEGKLGLVIDDPDECYYQNATLDRVHVEWLRDKLTHWLETGNLL